MLRHKLSSSNSRSKVHKKKKKKNVVKKTLVKEDTEPTVPTSTDLERRVFGGQADLLKTLVDKPEKDTVKDDEVDSEDPQPAWVDEDDEEIIGDGTVLGNDTLQKRLREKFDAVSAAPSWASLDKSKEKVVEEDTDLLSGAADRLSGSVSLPSGSLNATLCTDLNKEEPHSGKIRALQLHKNYQLGLTAGMDGRFALFQVNGRTNPKVQSVFIEKFPIWSARFSAEGNEIILGSRLKCFYTFDMVVGKVIKIPHVKGLQERNMSRFVVAPDGSCLAFLGSEGHVHLLTSRAKEHICTLKMNGSVDALAFSDDARHMYSFGDDAQVYVWDMNSRRCVYRFNDHGTIRGTALAVAGNHLATGNDSGIVSVYDRSSCLSSRDPTPLRSLSNLHTAITSLQWAPNTHEALAFASDWTEQAVRIAHMPTLNVFKNFPDRTHGVRIPICMDFSPHCGYFAVGNHSGRALLYRLNHFTEY